MSFLDPGHQHTNSSIRKLLGESGFLIRSNPVNPVPADGQSWSMWERGADRIWLVEHRSASPELRERTDTRKIIDPKTLGVRNPNIQNEGSPDE